MMCRCWRSGGLGVGRASMRSGSEKIRGSRLVCGVCSDLRLGRPDLTHRFSQPANNEWHSGSVPHAMVCAILPASVIYSILSSALFLVLPIHSCFIAGFIPLLFLFVLVYIPSLPFCYAGFCAISFTHRYQSSCITYASGLLCSQYPLLFASLASAVKTL
jgi:hypothetical protein